MCLYDCLPGPVFLMRVIAGYGIDINNIHLIILPFSADNERTLFISITGK